MELKEINSHSEMLDCVKNTKKAYILLYKKGSELSECALRSIAEAAKDKSDIKIGIADVNTVRDIHENYEIKTVPSLLEFEDGKFTNVFKGCNDTGYYTSVFENAIYSAKVASGEIIPQKRVVLYSTPTCSWCNTIKSYFKKHNVKFTEHNVAADQAKADEMVKKSGQQGVPQTEINGEMIVGFNQKRIDELLGIRN